MFKKTDLAMFIMLIGILLFSGCHHSKSSKNNEIKVSGEKDREPEVINGYVLPPKPDPVINNATLLGVDSNNNNGIRDDVERWIIKTFENAEFKNNLYLTDIFLQKAKNYQQRLANEDPTPKEVLKSYIQEQDINRCLAYLGDEVGRQKRGSVL